MTGAPLSSPGPHNLPVLGDRDIHLWRIDLAGEASPGAEAVLDARERDRAARFVFPRDRNRYLRAHHAMRILLGAYLAVPPEAVSIALELHDKPFLDSHPLGFNLSHSADRGMIAISRIAEIGVDMEMLRLPHNPRSLAESVFSASELETLARVPDTELASAFFTCWTRKEAYLKALGVGLTLDPAKVTVGMDSGRLRISIPDHDARQFVEVASIAEHDDWAAAVAAVGGYSNYSVFEYDHQRWTH